MDRFLAEIASPSTLRPGYVLLGDEAFLYQRCRQGILAALAPEATRDFSLSDLDLADTTIFVLDRRRRRRRRRRSSSSATWKQLYGRGSKEGIRDIDAYRCSLAVLLFRCGPPASPPTAQMDYQDESAEAVSARRSATGAASLNSRAWTSWTLSSGLSEPQARQIKFDPDAARELVDALGADMMMVCPANSKSCASNVCGKWTGSVLGVGNKGS